MNKFLKYSIIPIVIVSVIIPTLLILDNADDAQEPMAISDDLLHVLESCNNDSDFNPSSGISYSNGTHYIDDIECEWYKNLEIQLNFVESEEDKYLKDLHPRIIINLVNGLTQNYDKKGLENLRNANYIAYLSGGLDDNTRYLYIYDPDTNQFLGKHDNHPVGEFFITEINLDEGQSMWETFTKDTIPSPYNVYFKNHNGLVFASYYKAD